MKILFIDIDTLRPDHLGCYGYHRSTSPNIDKIAAQGIRFENYYCSDAPCLPSRASLLTGQHGIHTGIINHGGTCADRFPEGKNRSFSGILRNYSLWGLLWKNNIYTASFSTFGGRHGAWWFHAGLNEVHDIGWGGGESAEQITPLVIEWLERNASRENWCLHVNYWDPHTPYRVPSEFGNPFENDPLPEWITEQTVEEWTKKVGGHSALDYGMFAPFKLTKKYPRHPELIRDMQSARKMIDGYDCGIRYADEHVGRILDTLSAKGCLDETIIIITSDHGENLGELGCCSEHGTADYITHRIPMIIKWPGKGKKGIVISGLHYSLDILPTLAEIRGWDIPPHWDGKSYAPSITEGKDCGRNFLVLSQCCHGCQRSVRWKDWIYIRTYHDFYHLYPQEMLFNIKNDPHEQNNLAQKLPDVCAEATRQYLDWHDNMMRTSLLPVDPMWIVLKEGGPFHSRHQLKEYCQQLENTKRAWAIPELKKRHPEEFKQ